MYALYFKILFWLFVWTMNRGREDGGEALAEK